MGKCKYFENEVVVWCGHFGAPKKRKEDKGFDVSNFDHKVVITVEIAVVEIKQMLQFEGWDKYYVCPNEETADRLFKLIPAYNLNLD